MKKEVHHSLGLGFYSCLLGNVGMLTVPTLPVLLEKHHLGSHLNWLLSLPLLAQLLGACLYPFVFGKIGVRVIAICQAIQLLNCIAMIWGLQILQKATSLEGKTIEIVLWYGIYILGPIVFTITQASVGLLFRESVGDHQHKGIALLSLSSSILYAGGYWLSFHWLSVREWALIQTLISGGLFAVAFFIRRDHMKIQSNPKNIQWKNIVKSPSFKISLEGLGAQMAVWAFPVVLPLAIGITASKLVPIVTFLSAILMTVLTLNFDIDRKRSNWVTPIIIISRCFLLVGFIMLFLYLRHGTKIGVMAIVALACLAIGTVSTRLTATVAYKSERDSHVANSVLVIVNQLSGCLVIFVAMQIGSIWGYKTALLVVFPLLAWSIIYSCFQAMKRWIISSNRS